MLPFILKYPFQILTVVFLATTIICGTGWSNTSGKLGDERAAHKADVTAFKTAQKEANDKAEATKQKLLKDAEINAKKADTNYANLLGKYNASILRYKANQSVSKPTNSDQLPSTEGSDGPSSSTFISIPIGDAQVCAVNTARLQAVHDWAISQPQ